MQQAKTLVINRFDSYCAECGKSCDPMEEKHIKVLGDNELEGCGVEWEYSATDYADKDVRESVKRLRPDLEFVGIMSTPREQ